MWYDYKCLNRKCLKPFEVSLPITSKIEGRKHLGVTCPHCHSRNVVKLIPRRVHVTYKGSGFYSTDKDKK
jgi:predicted nucleic acid-binding Zn ribbon protein